jgi:hypothetical protein
MGQKQWKAAAALYEKVLSRDPNYPKNYPRNYSNAVSRLREANELLGKEEAKAKFDGLVSAAGDAEKKGRWGIAAEKYGLAAALPYTALDDDFQYKRDRANELKPLVLGTGSTIAVFSACEDDKAARAIRDDLIKLFPSCFLDSKDELETNLTGWHGKKVMLPTRIYYLTDDGQKVADEFGRFLSSIQKPFNFYEKSETRAAPWESLSAAITRRSN